MEFLNEISDGSQIDLEVESVEIKGFEDSELSLGSGTMRITSNDIAINTKSKNFKIPSDSVSSQGISEGKIFISVYFGDQPDIDYDSEEQIEIMKKFLENDEICELRFNYQLFIRIKPNINYTLQKANELIYRIISQNDPIPNQESDEDDGMSEEDEELDFALKKIKHL